MKNSNNISQELLETVERHLNKTMTEQEILDFELRLEEVPEFRSQVNDIKTLLLGIENQSLKDRLDNFHNEIPESHIETAKRKSKAKTHWGKIAAAILVFLAIGGFWWFSNPQNERLYAEYFEPDPGLPTTMSSTNEFEFYDAMVNYKQGDYKTAISKWEALKQNTPENDTINYFLGVAYMADKNVDQAIPYLSKTANNPKSIFLEDAYYYLGLAYLKANKVEKAKNTLEKSQSENSKKLLNDLK